MQLRWTQARFAALFFAFAWACGVALRLGFPGDIEYKGDEDWMFRTTIGMLHGSPWPDIGMDSSAGIPNPGLSVWIFAILGWVTRATTPIELARSVELLNCVAFTCVFVFAWRRTGTERLLWLWTAALAAVNPLGIILQRKIWAQSVLPLFAWVFFLAWRSRSTWGGAFLWGVSGLLLGQLHMSGFFYAAVFFGWSVFAHARKTGSQPTRWFASMGGSVVGALPMIPWLRYLSANHPAFHSYDPPPRWMAGNVWRLWLEDTLGWDLDYSLGPNHLKSLRIWTPFGERLPWPVDTALVIVLVIAIVLAVRLILAFGRDPAGVVERLGNDGAAAHNVAFLGYGTLMNLLPLAFWRHYLVIVFPFESMTLPLVARASRAPIRLTIVVWFALLSVSCATLWYLHANHGAPGGDYGVGYQFQRRR